MAEHERVAARLVALALGALLAAFSGGPLLAAEETGKAEKKDRPAAQAAAPAGPTADDIRRKLQKIRLPDGFRIGLYALVPQARAIAVGPQGKVLFVSSRGNELYAVETGGKGELHAVTPFAAAIPMKLPHGVCFTADGTLFVAEFNRVRSFADAEANAGNPSVKSATIVAEGQLIPPEHEGESHSRRVCRIGPDDKLYIALGQPFNVPPPDKWEAYKPWGVGGIIRMNRDGSRREVFATGIRNSVGLDFNPKDKTLWFTDNQVDRMGDDIPPGELNRATTAGQHFGFPWYGGGHVRTEEYKDSAPPKDIVFPQVEMAAHAADLGMTFYRGARFPAKYRGGVFSVQHGSWNRTIPIGARLMFTSLKPNGEADKAELFAEGWKEEDGSYWGRPADVAELPDGSLLVSDDYNGALYRISYEGK